MRTLLITLPIAAIAFHATALSEQPSWNEFRGPNGSGVCDACRPPVEIDLDQTAWVVDVPAGQSSPVLAGNRIFLTGVENNRLVTLAFDALTGEQIWRAPAPETPLERVHESSSPAVSTPCVDQQRVYVYFGSFGLLCYDLHGKELWRQPIPTPQSLYGMSSSPILHGNLLIMVLDDDANLPESNVSRSRIIALDKVSGELVWETARPFHRSGWSTPTIWKHPGGSELVVLGNGCVRGYDVDRGSEKWFISGFSRETIARPIIGNGFVFASASMIGGIADEQPDPEPFWKAILHFDANGDQQLQRHEMTVPFTFPYRPHLPIDHPGFGMPLPKDQRRRQQRLNGMFARIDKDKDGSWNKEEFLANISFNRGKPNLLAIRPGGEGDIGETHVEWALHRGIPEIPTPVCHHDRIYLVSDGGVLSAVDAGDGSMIYRKRLGASGHYRSSPVIAGGYLYVISEAGVVSVVKTGDKYELAGQYDLAQRIAATPAIDQQTIYIRCEQELLAFRRE